MKRVTLFSLSSCPVCKQVRKFLEDNRTPFTLVEVDTLESGEQWLMTKKLKEHNPQATYPTVVIEEVIRGFDLELLKKKLSEEDPGNP